MERFLPFSPLQKLPDLKYLLSLEEVLSLDKPLQKVGAAAREMACFLGKGRELLLAEAISPLSEEIGMAFPLLE